LIRALSVRKREDESQEYGYAGCSQDETVKPGPLPHAYLHCV
jgi:hypothetical protein